MRPLESIYPVVYADAIVCSVRVEGTAKKIAAYVGLAINTDGRKKVPGIYIGAQESAKYWLGIFNERKNRGMNDILVFCADGLSGMKEACAAAFPQPSWLG